MIFSNNFDNVHIIPGGWVNRPRNTHNITFLLLILLIFSSRFSEAAGVPFKASPEEMCAGLSEKYLRGFLSKKERDSYCINNCKFLKVDCRVDENSYETRFEAWKLDITEFIEGILDGSIVTDENYLNPNVDEATVDAWLELVSNTWPVFFCVIPVLLNQYKYYNFYWATALIIGYVAFCCSGFMPYAVAAHNILIAYLGLAQSANSTVLFDSIWTCGLVLAPVFALFVVDDIWHLAILVGTIVLFVAYLRWSFFEKRNGANAGTVVCFSQILLLMEQMHFVRTHMFVQSLGSSSIEAALSCIFPEGDSVMYLVNVVDKAKHITHHFPFGLSRIIIFCSAVVTQVSFFLLFRACLGAFYLYVLRYRVDFDHLMSGLFVYTADVFGPFRCMARIIFKYEDNNVRRLMYAITGMFLVYYEINGARGYVLLRVGVSIIDRLFLKSKYGRMMHYLSMDIDFMQASFPQDGAPSWISVTNLVHLGKYTGSLLSTDSTNRTFKGIGVILNSAGRTMLYTVKHVVRDSVLTQFKRLSLSSPDFRSVTNDDDPMVGMKIEQDDDAPDAALLAVGEIAEVKQLVFVNRADDEPVICVIPRFRLVKGKLAAMVNLRKGDSGGPVFAVMDDGSLRLCGVVSKGNPRSGGGNIISFCYADGTLSYDSSSDEPLNAVKAFNDVRRVRFASDDADAVRHHEAHGVREHLDENRELYEGMRPWLEHITWDDMSGDPDILSEDMHAADWSRLENRRGHDGDPADGFIDDDHDGGGNSNKGKADRRRRYRDKAYRKRAVSCAEVLMGKLKLVYSVKDAKMLFNNIMLGYVPVLNERQFVVSCEGDNWIISDSLPEPVWS